MNQYFAVTVRRVVTTETTVHVLAPDSHAAFNAAEDFAKVNELAARMHPYSSTNEVSDVRCIAHPGAVDVKVA